MSIPPVSTFAFKKHLLIIKLWESGNESYGWNPAIVCFPKMFHLFYLCQVSYVKPDHNVLEAPNVRPTFKSFLILSSKSYPSPAFKSYGGCQKRKDLGIFWYGRGRWEKFGQKFFFSMNFELVATISLLVES